MSIDLSVLPKYHVSHLADVDVFYIEAGRKDKPVLLLLHGFPSSSRQFRDLLVLLAPFFRIIAPDLPGYGLTKFPDDVNLTFDYLADTIGALVDALKLQKYSLYVFDFGAPTGYRLALKRPNQVQAIISQNGNAYEEGFGEFWNPLVKAWEYEKTKSSLTPEDLTEYRELQTTVGNFLLSPESFGSQYYDGEPETSVVNPEYPIIDRLLLQQQPNYQQQQLNLCIDYRHNVTLYPTIHKYFRDSQVPILVVWGINDPIFIKEGAYAFKRDSNAKVVEIDGGHFAAQTHPGEIAQEIVTFFEERHLF